MSAINTITEAPTTVGDNKNVQFGTVKNTITGLEPAGGFTVLVSIISEMARPTAIAIDYQ